MIRNRHPTKIEPSARLEVVTGETSAWLVSFLIHFLFLLTIGLVSTHGDSTASVLTLVSVPPEEMPLEQLVPDAFHVNLLPDERIGSRAIGGLADEVSGQPMSVEQPEVPSLEWEPSDRGQIEARELIDATSGPDSDLSYKVKGAAGVGVTGADGAIDRITQEILLSLEERDTLVVWFFDRSASLQTQRADVNRRFNRVYEELGLAQSSGQQAFARHRDQPLLTAVVAFAAETEFLVDKPTDDLDVIKRAVASITQDDRGIERVFTAFQDAARRYKRYRTASDRNVMFVAFTDEAGDDADALDQTVDVCRRLAIPVYVVGVPAPFGRRETLMKWVDPDPSFDQSPQWGRVDQGPETLLPERVQIAMSGFREDRSPIDSGFGPFALTRLCHETSGMYFTVHPNRRVGRRVSQQETASYSAYFSTFFDPVRMRRYQPEYVSAQEYMRRVQQSRTRSSLIQAAQLSWLQPLEQPRRRFVVRSEAELARDLTEAQKDAARIQPALEQLDQLLESGQDDRPKEIVPRWQAGYDLALGRVLANKVRADGYNSMLAQAKRGLKFSNEKNNTWLLNPSDEVSSGSRLQADAEQARECLSRVTREHEGTPWALLAQRELDQPLGWKWEETYTPIDPPARRAPADNASNANATPQDDRARQLPRPAPRRAPPKL